MSRLVCNTTLQRLADTAGTPLYVYDLASVSVQIRRYRAAIPVDGFTLLFATMANPAPEILNHLASEGVGACVNSLPHLRLVLDAGIPASRIQYTASGVARDQMKALIEVGVRVNLDSRRQIVQWRDLGGGPFGVRLNAGSLIGIEGDRLGLDATELDTLLLETPLDLIEGVHVYVGTNFLRAPDMFPTLRAFFTAAERLPALRYVNVGGGAGVDYAGAGEGFDIDVFGRELSSLHARLAAGRALELHFEPGRSLTASSGVFLSRVTDVKDLNGTTFVACDGSVAVFPRPFHQPESPHRVRALNGARGGRDVVVVGRTTFSRDILARCTLPSDIQVGDVLAFEDAGAYCSSMASRFLGQPDPAAVFVDPE